MSTKVAGKQGKPVKLKMPSSSLPEALDLSTTTGTTTGNGVFKQSKVKKSNKKYIGPIASEHFKTTVLPNGTTVSSYHVSGIDGNASAYRPGSKDTHEMQSTQRMDFSSMVMEVPQGRYGHSDDPWATGKLRHKDQGIVPSAKAKEADRFSRPRPATVPAKLGELQTTNKSKEDRDVEDDFKIILDSFTKQNVDVGDMFNAWVQNASLSEREICKRMVRDVAVKCAAFSQFGRPTSKATLRPQSRLNTPFH